MAQSRVMGPIIRRVNRVAAEQRLIRFAGLDPVPIGLAMAEPISDDALLLPACRQVRLLKP